MGSKPEETDTSKHSYSNTDRLSDCLSVTLSVCHSVSVFLQSAADDRETSRWKRPSTRPRTTRGLCQGSGRRTIPVCPLLQLLHTCTPGPARRALVHSPSPTVMVPTAQR